MNVYSKTGLRRMLEEDEINAAEAAFMEGYNADQKRLINTIITKVYENTCIC